MTAFVRLLLLLLLLLTVVADATTADRRANPDVLMPPPARAHCRVFIVAARTHTRVLVLQNAYEQDAIHLYDHVPAVSSIVQGIFEHDSSNPEDKKKATIEAYQILRRAVDLAAEWLKVRGDPRRCFVHFLFAESEIPASLTAPDDTTTAASRVTRRLQQLRDQAGHDRAFPFALDAVRREDQDRVPSSGIVTAAWRLYFHVVGINYFAERVAPSLSPGQVEVYGLLHVDTGGDIGRTRFESDADAVAMVFDVRERWRRTKRQRQANVVLNASDFYGREYAGFGRMQVQQAVVKLKQRKNSHADEDALPHPCFLRGHLSVVEGVNMTLDGTGDAEKCMTLLRSHVAASNVDCPPESFCFLGGESQPQKFESFYASGVLQRAVLGASRVLEHVSNAQEEDVVRPLLLPAPSLLSLRNAAKTLCALSYQDVAIGLVPSHLPELEAASLASDMERTVEPPSALCFDLCYTVVLLEQIGVQENDERIHFVDSFQRQPVLSAQGSVADRDLSSSSELVAWLTGTFLYLEALQRKVTFSLESELLAEQLSAGLPLGWNMSLLVFLAACVFLYYTTGRQAVSGQAGRGSSGYHLAVNGGAKAKYKDTTQSITFVDDARD